MWESLIAVYGNRNSDEGLPSGYTMDRIDFIDPKRLTDDPLTFVRILLTN
jgi:hypothetical protein